MEQPAGTPLRVLSYNVHGRRDDRAALAAVVRQARPDVVIVQEAPRRFRWRHKCAALAEDFGLLVAAGGLPALGNLLLTNLRVRVHRTWCQRYPLTPGRHLRGAVYAECSVPPATGTGPAPRFVVAGSHLSTDPAERPGQAAAFKAELDRIDLPVIVGADLNDTAGSAAWRTVADDLADSAVATDRADRCTFPCAGATRRIDGLFVDRRIAVVDYDVPDTELTRRASDHFPIRVDLALPGC
ncbi:endonuclease/exonuclease/phosphatase family protein [Micromonospora zhanjiangensis]|uniref:Endonuclease/exonuclease/phosphatase family protein n=1 Tax=Micromonospora zhanjiangensis TaxID=1522057 RepID=A0ABV8KHI2_9ACTN